MAWCVPSRRIQLSAHSKQAEDLDEITRASSWTSRVQHVPLSVCATESMLVPLSTYDGRASADVSSGHMPER